MISRLGYKDWTGQVLFKTGASFVIFDFRAPGYYPSTWKRTSCVTVKLLAADYSLTSEGCKTTRAMWRAYHTLRTSDKYVVKSKEFLGHSGSSITRTYTHVRTGSADCPLISHVLAENGVEIERTRTATVLSSVTWVNREQRPYVCVFYYILVLLRL